MYIRADAIPRTKVYIPWVILPWNNANIAACKIILKTKFTCFLNSLNINPLNNISSKIGNNTTTEIIPENDYKHNYYVTI